MLNPCGKTEAPGGAALDTDVTEEGRFLNALNPVPGAVSGLLINRDGSLTLVGNGITGVPMRAGFSLQSIQDCGRVTAYSEIMLSG